MSYVVEWSCVFEADSPEDAAMQAKGALQDPGNEAWVFHVKDEDGTAYVIDADMSPPYFFRVISNK